LDEGEDHLVACHFVSLADQKPHIPFDFFWKDIL
jgi:hypothetical protein